MVFILVIYNSHFRLNFYHVNENLFYQVITVYDLLMNITVGSAYWPNNDRNQVKNVIAFLEEWAVSLWIVSFWKEKLGHRGIVYKYVLNTMASEGISYHVWVMFFQTLSNPQTN